MVDSNGDVAAEWVCPYLNLGDDKLMIKDLVLPDGYVRLTDIYVYDGRELYLHISGKALTDLKNPSERSVNVTIDFGKEKR